MSTGRRGTPALLFTDIEGSTKLLEQLGSIYASVLLQHRALLQRTFEEHGGVVVGSERDSLFVVFEKASTAITAAIEGQRALKDESWPQGAKVRVRMGIHSGEADRPWEIRSRLPNLDDLIGPVSETDAKVGAGYSIPDAAELAISALRLTTSDAL